MYDDIASLRPKPYLQNKKIDCFLHQKDLCEKIPPLSNVLIGDSFISQMEWRHERLAKVYFNDWFNLGIGGDRVENLWWRYKTVVFQNK